MKEFIQAKEILISQLGSDIKSGLNTNQVQQNKIKYGENILTQKKPISIWQRIWDATTEPMLVLLIFAGIIALSVNIYRGYMGGETDYLECVGIFIAILLSVGISVAMEGKSAKAFEALSKMSDNVFIKVIRNNKIQLLAQQEIVVGDILLLSFGDKIPADGRLLESHDLSVDESALTGESLPVQKDAELNISDDKTPLAERMNMLYKGTYIVTGRGKLLVTAVGNNTEFGLIAKELNQEENNTTPLQEKLAKLGKNITIFGVCAAVIVFIAQIISFDYHHELSFEGVMNAFVSSIVLIVAAVPEGLPTIVAVSLSINIIKLSQKNALVKKMIASETIGCINVLCSDKTGTLTENKMKVVSFYDSNNHTCVSEFNNQHLMYNICTNTTADLGEEEQFIGNPTECALLYLYEHSEIKKSTNKTYNEIRNEIPVIQSFPFNSDLKHMSTIVQIGKEQIAYVKGSPEAIMAMCDITSSQKEEINKHIIAAEEKAMRVIAFAHKKLQEQKDYEQADNHQEMESHMQFDGFVAIVDPLRKEVDKAIKACQDAGIELKILTGDNIITATAIANELNLLTKGKIAVEAKDIAELSDEKLSKKLSSISVIARSTPSIKMRVVKLLKAQKNIVAVTGDGINDAPALKNADIGIAMGIAGTEVSKEASDIVLMDDSFVTIVKAIEWGRNIYENFKRFITFQLTVNFASVAVVFSSVLLGLKAPFTALHLLWVNIIMDGPPALSLGLEPNYKDLMKQQPTKRDESIISKPMLGRIILSGSYMAIIFLCQYIYNFLGVAEDEQRTVLFTLFVLFQLFNSFNCRELHSESIFKHLFANKLMLWVVGCTFILQIMFIQYAGDFFDTVPLSLSVWIKIFMLSFTIILWSELIKLFWRIHLKKQKQ